jgi:glycosyltransferase involved in cell wall biosynthesis
MRVIESAGYYFPDSVGGTEVYVNSLTKRLQASGIECVVAAPHQSAKISQYTHEGIEVFRYPFPERPLRSETQGRVPPRLFGIFEAWLRERRADVYHQHSWTTGCGLWHLQAAKQLGLKTLVTLHVPGNVCMRGTMLFEGRAACDGHIVPERCASCWLQSKGLPVGTAKRVAKLPEVLSTLARLPRIGPVLAANALAAGRKKDLHKMAAMADRIVTPCSWLYEALLGNGLAPRKLVLNRQGVGHQVPDGVMSRAKKISNAFRFGFLGRWNPVKGVHVLVEAFKRLPADLPVELVVCAVGEGGAAEKYYGEVRRSAALDHRIQIIPAVPHKQVSIFLAGIDALVVPSQWLETGPIVVLEAFAVGTPVIGSDLGGISELVSHGRNGLLVPHDDVSAWTAAMMRLAADPVLLPKLREEIGPVRTMSDVASDMVMLYRNLFLTQPHAA